MMHHLSRKCPGERNLRLHKQRNTRTDTFQLARIACDSCTCLPSQPSPYCGSPSLMGEGTTLQHLACLPQRRTPVNLKTEVKLETLTLHCTVPLKMGSFKLLLPFVLKFLPTPQLAFSWASTPALVALRFSSQSVALIDHTAFAFFLAGFFLG